MSDEEAVLVAIQPDGSEPPLFGIHVLGVNMRFYRPLADRLGPEQPVFGVWSAGATAGLAGASDAVDVARRYADQIEDRHPAGPIALAAVSLGSVVAFELAHQLNDRGRDVALLALFDATGPHIDRIAPSPGRTVAVHLRELLKGPPGYVEGRLRLGRARVKRRLEIVNLRVRRAARLPVDDDLQRREFVEGNAALQLAYDYRPYPGRVVVFKAGDDAFTRWQADGGMGWAPVITGQLDVAVVPGGHLSMLAEPNVEFLASELAAVLAKAPQSPDR